MAKKNDSKELAVINKGVSVYQLDSSALPDLADFKSLRIPIVKPREMPTGSFVIGEVKSVEESDMKSFKSTLLRMESEDGNEFKFPVTATIARQLQPSPEAFVGRTIFIRKTGEATGKTGKKTVHLFEVRVKE
jgi:hypothetical protein